MGRDAEGKVSDDGLITPIVGDWSARKYHFLARYIQIFSRGMKNQWRHRHYIDLFAGAGVVRLERSQTLCHGSPLLAASVQDPFDFIHACEGDADRAAALDARLSRTQIPHKVYHGNANAMVDNMLKQVPARDCLSMAFVDPYGLHFDFETARKISSRKCDLVILLADRMDAMRNWAAYYHRNPESSLDKFMGESGWRRKFEDAPSDQFAQAFREHYQNRLTTLGYLYFGLETVPNSRGVPIYSLMFASKHQLGLKFWNEACGIDEKGQRGLNFEPR